MSIKLLGSVEKLLSYVDDKVKRLDEFLFTWRRYFEYPDANYSVYKAEISDFKSTLLGLGERISNQSSHEPLWINEQFWPSWGYKFDLRGVAIGGWLYQGKWYEITSNHSIVEQRLLVLEYGDMERQKFERLKSKFSEEQNERVKYERERIPESVRVEVWRRDEGKCANCGSREKLGYDHIVPISRGGSNTARNVELLCEGCNRMKGNRIQ